MKNFLLFFLLTGLLSCGSDAPEQDATGDDQATTVEPEEDQLDLTIRPGEGFGPYTDDQSRERLMETLQENSISDQEFYLGEGETAPGLLLHPGTQHEVEVLLDEDGDPLIYRVHQEGSEWQGADGLTIGTSLAEVEKINGKPFKLTGFDWDYGGTVTNWQGGQLAHEGFLVVFDYDSSDMENKRDDLEQILGDHEIESNLPALGNFSPRVVRIEQRY